MEVSLFLLLRRLSERIVHIFDAMRYRKVLIASGVVVAATAVAIAVYGRSEQNAMQALRAANAAASFAGRRAVVVGGTSGIGEAVAKRLAQAQFSVAVVGRSAERGRAIIAELKALSPTADHEFLECDAFLLANAKTCASSYIAKHDKLDVLVVSQGMATIQGRTVRAIH